MDLASARLSKLEFQIMEALWGRGQLSIREIQEEISARKMPAYTTVQTTVYRMEAKGVVRRVKKVANFHVFEAVITRERAQRGLIDDLLSYFEEMYLSDTNPAMRISARAAERSERLNTRSPLQRPRAGSFKILALLQPLLPAVPELLLR